MHLLFKSLGLLLLIISCSGSHVRENDYLDPTGTYKQPSRVKGGTVSGDIQVKAVEKHKIILNLYVNKGAPSYNSGSAFDTLAYENNKAVYQTSEYDSSCKITFAFNKKGVSVEEKTDDYNSGCGFGHAVVADGFFKKTSSKKPVFMNYATGRKME